MPIDPINSVQPNMFSKAGQIGQPDSALNNFGQILTNAVNSLNQTEQSANTAIADLAAGENVELHQVMLAMEEADIAVQLALQVRNKLVEAYQEVMRMQV